MFKPLQKVFHRDRFPSFIEELENWEFALIALERDRGSRLRPLEGELRDRNDFPLHDFPPSVALPWWIKIKTKIPVCTYYFGPFASEKEASLAQPGYIDDLAQEEAQGITSELGRGYPPMLTIFEED